MRYVGPRQVVIDNDPTPVPFWPIPRSFEGQAVAIIGGGPSLATFDLGALSGHRFIVVNSGCRRLAPVAGPDDVLYFTDNSWNENRPELAAAWPGVVVTANRNAKMRLGAGARYIDVTGLTAAIGAMPDHVQASSGHIASCLAVAMGAGKLVLIGFECGAVKGRTHGHGDYSQTDMAAFDERFLPGWLGLAKAFERLGVEVVNATPGGRLEVFRRAPLAEAFA